MKFFVFNSHDSILKNKKGIKMKTKNFISSSRFAVTTDLCATLAEAAKVLRKAGVERVWEITLAHGE